MKELQEIFFNALWNRLMADYVCSGYRSSFNDFAASRMPEILDNIIVIRKD